jgi:hypothetical protein
MPLFDVVGSGASVAPEHIGATALNVGVTFGFTVTSKLVPNTHPGPVAVKTYVPDLVLSIEAGDQVPLTPLVDVVGNAGGVLF